MHTDTTPFLRPACCLSETCRHGGELCLPDESHLVGRHLPEYSFFFFVVSESFWCFCLLAVLFVLQWPSGRLQTLQRMQWRPRSSSRRWEPLVLSSGKRERGQLLRVLVLCLLFQIKCRARVNLLGRAIGPEWEGWMRVMRDRDDGDCVTCTARTRYQLDR